MYILVSLMLGQYVAMYFLLKVKCLSPDRLIIRQIPSVSVDSNVRLTIRSSKLYDG